MRSNFCNRYWTRAALAVSLSAAVFVGCKRPSENPSAKRSAFLSNPEELDTQCQLALADELAGTITPRPKTDIRGYTLKVSDFKFSPVVYSDSSSSTKSFGVEVTYEPTMDYDHLAWKACDSAHPGTCTTGRFIGSPTELTNLPATTVDLEISACVDGDRAIDPRGSLEVCATTPLRVNKMVLSETPKAKPGIIKVLAQDRELRFEALVAYAREFKAELAKSLVYHSEHPTSAYLDALTLKSSQNMLQGYSVYYMALLFSQEATLLKGYFATLAQEASESKGAGLAEGTQTSQCTSRLGSGDFVSKASGIVSPLSPEQMSKILEEAGAKSSSEGVNTLGIPDESSTTPSLVNGASTVTSTDFKPENGHTIAFSKPFLTALGWVGIVGGSVLLFFGTTQGLLPPDISRLTPWNWTSGLKGHKILQKVEPHVRAYNKALENLKGLDLEKAQSSKIKASIDDAKLKLVILKDTISSLEAPKILSDRFESNIKNLQEIGRSLPVNQTLSQAAQTNFRKKLPNSIQTEGPRGYGVGKIISGSLGVLIGGYAFYENARKPAEGANLTDAFPEATDYYRTMIRLESQVYETKKQLDTLSDQIRTLGRSP